MLVLTRKPGETIHIADDVMVTVLEVTGHRVLLGIQAPRSTRIRRHELVLAAGTDDPPASDRTAA